MSQAEKENIEPSEGLLMSMAIRLDHGLAVPEYYDNVYGKGAHILILESALSSMRKVWEEMNGCGFYSKERDYEYLAMLEAARSKSSSPHPSQDKSDQQIAP